MISDRAILHSDLNSFYASVELSQDVGHRLRIHELSAMAAPRSSALASSFRSRTP